MYYGFAVVRVRNDIVYLHTVIISIVYTYIFRYPDCARIIRVCEKLQSTHDATDSTAAIEMLQVSRFVTTFTHRSCPLGTHTTNFIRVLYVFSTVRSSRNQYPISAIIIIIIINIYFEYYGRSMYFFILFLYGRRVTRSRHYCSRRLITTVMVFRTQKIDQITREYFLNYTKDRTKIIRFHIE